METEKTVLKVVVKFVVATLLPFCPIFAPIIVKSFIFSTLGTLFMHNILSRFMGISVLKPNFRNIENSAVRT